MCAYDINVRTVSGVVPRLAAGKEGSTMTYPVARDALLVSVVGVTGVLVG